MPLSSGQQGTGVSRVLNQLQYAVANIADDITTAATGDKLLVVDVSDNYAIKYADGDNISEIMAGTTVPSRGAGLSSAETYAASVQTSGGLKTTRIIVDLTGLAGSTTDLDIIGNSAAASAHAGQITVAINGTLVAGRVTCLELPAGGVTDIDFYSATVGTGTQDVDVTTLTETALVTSGGVWTSGASKGMTLLPPANDYLYICNGAAGVPGTFTAGKFLIELFGV